MNQYPELEKLRLRHDQLNACMRKEETQYWSHLVRIEALKKEKLRKKNEDLRKKLHSFNM